MDKMNSDLIAKIEKIMNIKFDYWQRHYLLDEPFVFDMTIVGRHTGKTLVYIIKQLFESSEPLILTTPQDTLKVSDWWCFETKPTIHLPYIKWYKDEVRKIYELLNESGIKTRPVKF